MSAPLARDLGLRPGDPLRVAPARGGGQVLPAVPLTVAGVVELPFSSRSDWTVVVPLELFAGRFGPDRDDADLVLVASRPGVAPEATVAALRRALPGLHVFSNAELLERLAGSDFSYFRHVSAVLASITAFFAFLLVATLLTVAVGQRLGEVAALRALGLGRRRVALDLAAEAALLAGAGWLLSLPLGLVLARVLDGILRQLPELPERVRFFVLEPRALLLHALVLAASALVGAAWPVALAVRLPIAPTLRREVQ